MLFADLRCSLHSRYLSVLNVFRFVEQQAFQTAYDLCSEEERKQVLQYIESSDREAIAFWVQWVLKRTNSFELLDVRCLREIARDKSIRNYSSMSRVELIGCIQATRKENDDTPTAGTENGNGNGAGEIREVERGLISKAV